MPWANNAVIQSLRMQYNAALTAHKASRLALMDASIGGATPSAEMVDAEVKSSALLEKVRAKLLAEMTKAIVGHSDGQPPPPKI
jgi:hypothetical protein